MTTIKEILDFHKIEMSPEIKRELDNSWNETPYTTLENISKIVGFQVFVPWNREKITTKELIKLSMRGPLSDWKDADGNPIGRSGFYASWNHRQEEGITQEKADQKLIDYFKISGYLSD